MKSSSRIALLATAVVALSSLSSAAIAASINGNASATVLTPITVTQNTALSFGTLAANAAGSVTISTAGGRTFSGVVVTPGGFAAGAFGITGSTGATFAITLGTPTALASGGNSMAFTVASSAATGTIALGVANFTVGGTLTVAAGQAAGSYIGTYPVTVEYN